jgi:VWFA-related protein
MNPLSFRRGFLSAAVALWLGTAVLLCPALCPTAGAAPVSLTIHYIEAAPEPQQRAIRTLAYFTVLDEAGTPLLDLPSERFEVLEDGSPVEVEQISIASDPMAVVLAIDTSGSMLAKTPAGAHSIDAVKEAAITFISLLSEGDRIALFTFDNDTELRLDFTDDRQEAIEAVRRISATPHAFTRLYDTALAAVKKAAEFPRGRRAVILLTDGRDEKSGGLPFSIAKVRDVIDAATTRTIRVPIYTIGAGPRVDADALARISALTGGKSLTAASAADVAALYRSVADQLKHPYRLLYFSRTPSGEHSLVVKYRMRRKAVQDERRFWSPPLPMLTPPSVQILSPAADESIPGNPVVKFKMTPEDQVVRIRAYVDGRLILDKDQPPLDRFLLSTAQLPPGRHLLRVEALNAAGAMGAAEIPVSIPVPSVKLTRPEADHPVHGKVVLELQIESETPVEKLRLRVDGVVKGQWTAPPFEAIPWDTSGLAAGGHTVRIEAVDQYGRSGIAEAVFQVKPLAWTRLLPWIAGIAAVGVLLLGYLVLRGRAKEKSGHQPAPEPVAPRQPSAASVSPSDEDETVFFDDSVEPKAAPDAVLTILESPGLEAGTTFDIKGSASVGRHDNSDVRLTDKSVSRKHAEIYFDGSSYFLRDLGSRYGTTVNRHRISLDAAPLFDGALIKLGPRSTFEFTLPPAEPADDATLVNPIGENDDTFQVDH